MQPRDHSQIEFLTSSSSAEPEGEVEGWLDDSECRVRGGGSEMAEVGSVGSVADPAKASCVHSCFHPSEINMTMAHAACTSMSHALKKMMPPMALKFWHKRAPIASVSRRWISGSPFRRAPDSLPVLRTEMCMVYLAAWSPAFDPLNHTATPPPDSSSPPSSPAPSTPPPLPRTPPPPPPPPPAHRPPTLRRTATAAS